MNQPSEAKLHFLDYWRVIRMRMGLILLTFFLVMVTAGVYVVFLPKEYYSRATIDIKPDNNRGMDPLGMNAGNRADPQFISTQFQILRKSSVLHPVIEKLDLIKKLSPPGQMMPKSYITRLLERSMTVQEQRNTTLIEVGVYHTDKQLAADIANTIVYTYREIRQEETKKAIEDTLKEMRDELNNKRIEVDKLNQDAATIRNTEQIIDPDTENNNVLLTTADSSLRTHEELVARQRALLDSLRTQMKSIESLQPSELTEALRTLGIEDQDVTSNTVPGLNAAALEESRLIAAGLGDNHHRLKQVRAQRGAFELILTGKLEGIRRAQRTKLALEEEQFKKMEERLEELRKRFRDDKDRTNRYAVAKSSYLLNKNLLLGLESRYQAESFNKRITTQPVIIREQAEPGLSPEKPKIATYLLVAAVIGVVVGVGLAFFIEYLDTSVKNIEDIERYLALSVLAVIPKDIAILIRQKRDSADAEAYRILKANIEFNQTNREANTYTLVSGGSGEGKSTTLANLAYTYAKGGANVLVVDADLRRPSQHRFFDTDNNLGLADYLHGKAGLDEIIRTTRLDNLSFIASGKTQEDAAIISSARMTELIEKLKHQYDIVFFDSPPILGISDASLLVSEVDNTIMVVQHRRFPRGMLQRVKQAVSHVGGNLIGVVLNNVDTKHDDSYSYYSNYNDYYAPRRERASAKPATAGAKHDDEGEY